MSTLIFGKGFVGNATASILQSDIVWHDPAQGYTCENLQTVERVIICVPTPSFTNGLDHTAVIDCLLFLAKNNWTGPVAVRSTCMPTAFASMLYIHANLIYWPEFLREAHALSDAANPTQVVIGGEYNNTLDWKNWLDLQQHAIDAAWTLTDIYTASMIKLGINAALAAKVTMFNSLYAATQQVSGNWETVRDCVGRDSRIGMGQSAVPGPDGLFGFGGKCLPKDLNALSTILADDKFLQGILLQNTHVRNNK